MCLGEVGINSEYGGLGFGIWPTHHLFVPIVLHHGVHARFLLRELVYKLGLTRLQMLKLGFL